MTSLTLTSSAATAADPPAWDRPVALATLVRNELRKSLTTRSGRWLLLATALLIPLVLAIDIAFGNDSSKTFADLLATATAPLALLLPVIGVLAATSEFSQRTAMTTFTLVRGRGRVLLAKTLATLLLGLATFAIAIVCAAAAAVIAPAVTSAGAADWTPTGWQLLGALANVLLGMLMGVGFGLALLSSALAIVVYFALPTAFAALGGSIAAFRDVDPWINPAESWTALMTDGLHGATEWAHLAVTIALWVGLPLAIGIWRVHRREIA